MLCGRLSLREDEEPKIVMDSVSLPPDENSIVTADTASQNSDKPKKSVRKGLFVRFCTKNCEEVKKSTNLITILRGCYPYITILMMLKATRDSYFRRLPMTL